MAVGGNDYVRDEVVVAVKDPFWVAVRVIITSKLPDDDSFVYQLALAIVIQACPSTVNVIPLEAVRIISGFSDDVAIAVTHPLWPSRDPRKRSDSAILRNRLSGRGRRCSVKEQESGGATVQFNPNHNLGFSINIRYKCKLCYNLKRVLDKLIIQIRWQIPN